MGLIDFDAIEGHVANNLKLFISMAAGILLFVGIIAIAVFFIAVRGAEQTMVPNVEGKELTEALLELQVKELYPRIQLRYSQNPQDKGFILEQDPRAGSIVKAGRRIRLVVSQGLMISRVENYVGRDLNELRMDLQTLATGQAQPLLSLKEPIIYEYSAETPGTILRQRPEPGTDISGPVALELVVSRGLEDAMISVPRLTGLSIGEALEQIGMTGIDFTFVLRAKTGQEKGETIVAQDPQANVQVRKNTKIRITATPPDNLTAGEVFRMFRYTIPPNPYPLGVRLEALLPSGERQRIISVEYPGGDFTVPCKIPAGTVLILSVLNREIYRETVSYQTEALSLDQL